METRNLGLCLSRILSGFYIFLHNSIRYKLIYPDISIKYDADIYADSIYQNNKFNDWVKEDEILDSLVDLGIWTYQGDKDLAHLEKQLDDQKVELFQNVLSPKKTTATRRRIQNIKTQYSKYYDLRHSLDHLTADGYSRLVKNQYILIHSLFDSNNHRIFPDLDTADYTYLNEISTLISSQSLDISTFRNIAKGEAWRSYWSANKTNVFHSATTSWTDEQKTLVILSKMYDSAYEHPECPSDDIIADDDMFDGWMIQQRRENEKIKNKNRTEKMLEGKNLGNAQEVFLMPSSRKEAENIYNLNDMTARHTIKERNNTIANSSQPIDASKLNDVQRDNQVLINKMFMEQGKNNG